MIRHVLVAVAILALSASGAGAQTKVEKGPIKAVPASNAAKMFSTYCAVCHGHAGKGNGPAAAALTKVPADLTRISARNGGTFPAVKVKRYIEGLDEVAAHGPREMPMWGDLFKSLDRDTVAIRVEGLTQYLKAMQQ